MPQKQKAKRIFFAKPSAAGYGMWGITAVNWSLLSKIKKGLPKLIIFPHVIVPLIEISNGLIKK